MPVRKLAAFLVAVIATVAGGHQVGAQEQPPGTWGEPDGILEFDTDFRWFETAYNADIEELSPKHRANHGWYATFDRAYMMVNRSETEASYTQGDYGWGNRLDFGYMGDDDRGWAMTYWSLTGPNVFDIDVEYRANVINTEDPQLPSAETPEVFDEYGQLLPRRDRDNHEYLERIYEVKDSLNVIEMKGFELNRTWRLESYRKGGLLEPMIGLKYVKIRDHTENDTYNVQPGLAQQADGTFAELIQESFNEQIDLNENEMYGGQFGFRYIKFYNRFTNSLDLRAFAMQNFQNNAYINRTTDTYYDIALQGEIDGEIAFDDSRHDTVYAHGSEFVFGFDVRAESSLQLTRDINLRAGVQVIDFAQGILRGQVRNPNGTSLVGSTAVNDQNVWLVGYTFGLTINR
ncbi:hypothetical protein CA51_19900 [Rosistilla oblonga]|uniref:hypothetical protein n=1 Tax=Rosistilla oblonga TaxID=2527990 RepID=UPI001187E6DB|nr:hypothetical protein [Rosistilla oblonga]QDV12114.1 hypothetical protein CA51_19900 [Rosistilla oblonga]